MAERRGALAVKRAIDEEEARRFESYRWLSALGPFDFTNLKDVSLEVLAREKPVTDDPSEKEAIELFQKHLESLEPALSAENIKEVRRALSIASIPAVAGNPSIDVPLTVADFKQIKRPHLYKLGLDENQILIPLRLFSGNN